MNLADIRIAAKQILYNSSTNSEEAVIYLPEAIVKQISPSEVFDELAEGLGPFEIPNLDRVSTFPQNTAQHSLKIQSDT